MNIRIKRIYAPPEAKDGRRILVDRIWPRGIGKEEAKVDEWLRDIAPSTELRRWFGHDRSRWPEFCRRYADELAGNEALVTALREQGGPGTITLLFAARDEECNNAVALQNYLQKER